MSDAKILTVAEVAGILRISRVQAYDLVKKGVIPSLRLGRNIRIYEKAFNEWLEKNGGQGDIINLSKLREGRQKCQSDPVSYVRLASGPSRCRYRLLLTQLRLDA